MSHLKIKIRIKKRDLKKTKETAPCALSLQSSGVVEGHPPASGEGPGSPCPSFKFDSDLNSTDGNIGQLNTLDHGELSSLGNRGQNRHLASGFLRAINRLWRKGLRRLICAGGGN